MKRFIALLAFASLAACSAEKSHKADLFHFHDGRTGFKSDDGMWYYLMMADSGSTSPTVSGSSLGLRGSYGGSTFVKGSPPTQAEEEQATEEEVVAEADSEADSATSSGDSEASSGSSEGDGGSSGGDGGGGGGE